MKPGAQEEIVQRLERRAAEVEDLCADAPFRNRNYAERDFSAANWAGEDFSGACLRRASFRSAVCKSARFVGASLVDADLSYADFTLAQGLLPGTIAGADTCGALLPAHLAGFESLGQVKAVSEAASKVFLTLLAVAAYLLCTVAGVSDSDLIANSNNIKLPVVDASVPASLLLVAGPVLLVSLWLYFHLYLQRLWEMLAQLPAIFPDGKRVDEHTHPWLMNDLCIESIPRLMHRRIPLLRLQLFLLKSFGWLLVPSLLLGIWAVGLRVQSFAVTTFQVVCFALSITLAWWFRIMRKETFLAVRSDPPPSESIAGRGFTRHETSLVLGFVFPALFLSFLSLGAFTLDLKRGLCLSVAQWVFNKTGLRTSMRAPGYEFCSRPTAWTGRLAAAQEEIALVRGSELTHRSFRRLEAPHSFLVGAQIHASLLDGANFSNSDFRAARITDTLVRRAVLADASFASRMAGPDHERVEQEASPAYLESSTFEESNLHEVYLSWVTAYSVSFERTDFSNVEAAHSRWYGCSFEDAYIRHSSFEHAEFGNGTSFAGSDCRGSSFRAARFADADLTGANLSECALDGADLRSVKGLSSTQLKACAGYAGAQLPVSLAP